jgi:uncharacterized membrane protein
MEVQAADGNNTNNNNNNNNQNNGNSNQNVDVKSFIAIGDSKGMVHLIKLHPEFGNSTEVGMKKKNQILFAQSVKVSHLTTLTFQPDPTLFFYLIFRKIIQRYKYIMNGLHQFIIFQK